MVNGVPTSGAPGNSAPANSQQPHQPGPQAGLSAAGVAGSAGHTAGNGSGSSGPPAPPTGSSATSGSAGPGAGSSTQLNPAAPPFRSLHGGSLEQVEGNLLAQADAGGEKYAGDAPDHDRYLRRRSTAWVTG
jgi:hypothetical protein